MKSYFKMFSLIIALSTALASCGGGVSETQSGGSTGTPTAAAAINLPKTGQTISYGTGAIDDGAFQTGIAWPNPRFTTGTGGEVACVTDNLTGLMWVKTPDATLRAWQQALDYANSLVLCGHSDWRLPDRNELRSLINYGLADSSAWLNSQGFSNVQAYGYWSSSTFISNTSLAWVNSMIVGSIFSVDKPKVPIINGHYMVEYVWPVRSTNGNYAAPAEVPKTGQKLCYGELGGVIDCANTGQDGDTRTGIAWPNPRFTVGTGAESDCVTDNLTGLMWVKNPGPDVPWQEALNFAAVLDRCGYSDWRLPNVNELESLIHAEYTREASCGGTCATNAAWLNTQGFSNNVQAAFYWTSTTFAGTTADAWVVDMNDGGIFRNGKPNACYVWPVRRGQ